MKGAAMVNDSKKPLRLVKARTWSGIGLSLAAGLAMGAPAEAAGIGEIGPERLWLAQAEGGEGGESGASVEDLGAEATVGILTEIGEIEGNLLSGVAFFRAGQTDKAVQHFSHPRADIYPVIEEALAARKVPPFETELDALTKAATDDPAGVEAAFTAAMAAIGSARVALAAEPRDEFAALVALVRNAGVDLEKGIKDKAVADAGEYEDGWGYVEAARIWAARLAELPDEKAKKAAAKAMAALGEVAAGLPGVAPGAGVAVATDSGLVLSAAARIELASYGVK